MAYSTREMLARIVDLFGAPASANPNQLYGNLMVSPNGNILVGTLTDDNVHKLQVNGTTLLGGSGLVFPDGSFQYGGAPNRNRIINGRGLIAQRGTSVAAGSAGYTYGGPDHFLTGTGGQGGFTQTQGTMTVGGIAYPCITQTVTTAVSSFSAATVWSGVQQIMEGYNAYDLVNQQISVSFLFYTNVTGTFSVALVGSGGTYSNIQTFSATAGVVTLVQLTYPAFASLVIPQSNVAGLYLGIGMLGGTTGLTSTYGSWVNANNNHATANTNWAATVGNFISVTNVKVEKGPVCTPYEDDDYGQLLMHCQRYYQTWSGTLFCTTTTGNFGGGIVNMTGVPMRLSSTPAAAVNTNSTGGYAGGVSCSITNANVMQAWFSTTATPGQYCAFTVTGNAEY